MLASLALIALIGIAVGITTALFGFGGGFVAVPVIALFDAGLGARAIPVATATSALVMLVNGIVATVSTDRRTLARLRGRGLLVALLAAGGAAGAAAGRFSPEWLIRWGFVAYVAITIADLLLRPGFLRRTQPAERDATPRARKAGGVPDSLGFGIGAVAAFLGVGGSVMTVPLMRRAGTSMAVAATLANPLTVAVVAPAFAVSLLLPPGLGQTGAATAAVPGLVGSVDVPSALALLVGAIPVIVLLRRRPPRIPDGVHAWTYLALLAVSAGAVALAR